MFNMFGRAVWSDMFKKPHHRVNRYVTVLVADGCFIIKELNIRSTCSSQTMNPKQQVAEVNKKLTWLDKTA